MLSGAGKAAGTALEGIGSIAGSVGSALSSFGAAAVAAAPEIAAVATAVLAIPAAFAAAIAGTVMVAAKLLPQTTPEQVLESRAAGSVAAWKLYPGGATTHSADGIPGEALADPGRHTWLGDLLDAMERSRLALCLHGEMPQQEDPLLREGDFLAFVSWVLSTFPRLRVVLEHITTAEAVDFVRSRASAGARLAASITVHHLYYHLGHLVGTASLSPLGAAAYGQGPPGPARDGPGDGKLHPHVFCMPVLKPPPHREALRGAALSGLPCFYGSSDSAPHEVHAKESACGCAGVFNASVQAEALAAFFFQHGAVDRMPGFVAHFADRFHGRPGTGRLIALEDDPWTVPDRLPGNVVPLFAGQTLRWRMAGA
jgi:dihydroorotase